MDRAVGEDACVGLTLVPRDDDGLAASVGELKPVVEPENPDLKPSRIGANTGNDRAEFRVALVSLRKRRGSQK
ncbi:MAG: hypothetical protein NTZ58_03180 [Solirubrobacterales bacterium]|nr:hypothetical protein [Solirubrobacterales bacterium]